MRYSSLHKGNVSYALQTFADLRLVQQSEPYLGLPAMQLFGLTDDQWFAYFLLFSICPYPCLVFNSKCVQKFLPNGPANTIGFFIAKFTKMSK